MNEKKRELYSVVTLTSPYEERYTRTEGDIIGNQPVYTLYC